MKVERNTVRGWLALLTALVLSGAALRAQGSEAMRPLEHFAASPQVAQVVLSPSGQRYAALVNSGDETRVITRSLGETQPRVALSTDNSEHRFAWIRWINDERLAVSIRFESRRRGVDLIETRLVSLRFDGSDQVALLRNPPGDRYVAQVQDDVVDWMEDDGSRILMDAGRELVSVDAKTGERRTVASTAYFVGRWITDARHRPRVITRGVDKDLVEVMHADGEGGEWRALWRFERRGREVVWPLGFGNDPDRLYVQAWHEGRLAVFVVDLKDPRLEKRLVLAHPTRDVRGYLVRSAGGVALGLSDSERPDNADWWDPGVAELARSLDQALPDRSNRLLQFSRDGSKYLVYSVGNGKPGRYYLGDRASGRLSQLGLQYPQLEQARLAGKQALMLRARDGLSMRAFLTRPARAPAASAPLPLVLLAQGSPAAQDGQGFTPLTEFLADRGYAVLQVEYRGSSGAGFDFHAAGLQRWGLEMQDDLADAVQWAIAEKVADPARICIVGASFGGYASLMGAVKTPRLYRCAASLNGVADLIDFYDHRLKYAGGKADIEAQLGHAWQDRERLVATSPARQAARIQAPVLLVHAGRDRSVPVEQGSGMAAALKAAGKPYEWVELPAADHALNRQSDRVAYYKALEAFLGKHLAP